MSDRSRDASTDPRHHTLKLKTMLNDVAEHARDDIKQVSDPRAQALFETTAEVLEGLINAYEHYERRAPAWQ